MESPESVYEALAEKERVFNHHLDEVWLTAINTLVDLSYVIRNINKETGLLSTDYKVAEISGFIRAGYRYRLNLLINEISNDFTKVYIRTFFEGRLTNELEWMEMYRSKELIYLERTIFNRIEGNL